MRPRVVLLYGSHDKSIVCSRAASFNVKSGLVMPLLKKPGLGVCDHTHFRPITNLTTILKILKRLAFSHLKLHIASSPNYCAFLDCINISAE